MSFSRFRDIEDFWINMPPKSMVFHLQTIRLKHQILHFVICSNSNNCIVDKNNIHRIFYKTLQDISNIPKDSQDLQEVRDLSKKLLRRKKVSRSRVRMGFY